jgi:hypothetical protein
LHPQERTARLEEVVDLLDEIAMMFVIDPASVWNYPVEGDPGCRRVEFLAKISMAIAILQNQVEYEKEDSAGDGERSNTIQ